MRRAAGHVLVIGVLLAVALVGFVPQAAPAPDPVQLRYACALKSNGAMRPASSPSDCDPRSEVVVEFSLANPVTVCIKPGGSVRLGPCRPPHNGTEMVVPSATPAFFCGAINGKPLKIVTDPAACRAGEAFFSTDSPPSDISLSNASVAENQPVGTVVGTLSATDPDVGDAHTFSLVSGPGDSENGSFQIVGSSLRTSAVFDFETQSSYSIRVRATDLLGLGREEVFTISVTDVVENAAPTDISLSNASVAENQPAGTVVGTFTTTDPDAGDTHVYSLVSGPGDSGNGSFQIVGSTLRTGAVFDFETQNAYSIRIRTEDGNGGVFEKQFTLSVTDVVENAAPTDVALSNASVAENQPAGTTVGTLSATDPDVGDSHTFSLVSGPGDSGNGSFQIVGSALRTNAVFDFETQNSYSLRIRTEDGNGGVFEKQFTISVTDVVENAAPTDIALSNASVVENQPAGTVVGTFTTTDPDAGDTHAYSLVSGPGDSDNASFQVVGSSLRTAAVFDFEADNSLSIRVRTTDSGSATFEKVLTISVTNVNEAPTAVDDSYGGAIGNTLFAIGTSPSGPVVIGTGNVLTHNDSDPEGGPVSAVAETVGSTGGGTATINADGSFTYMPGAGDKSQADTFTYRLTDGTFESTGTVTITISRLIWYVNNAAPPGGDGRSNAPFNSLAPLNGFGGMGDVDGGGDHIFLYQGSGSYSGGLRLEMGQSLIGQPFGLLVDGNSLVPPAGANPTITNVGDAAVTLADGVVVQRTNVSHISGAGFRGIGVNNATVGTNLTVTTAGGVGLELNGGAGSIEFGAAITSSTGRSVSIENRTGGSVRLTGSILDIAQGIRLDANTGATTNFTGQLTLNTGSGVAFSATNGGTVNVTGSANVVSSLTGTPVIVQNTTIGTGGITLRSVSANGAPNGIVLQNTGSAGSFTVTGTGGAGSGGTIRNVTDRSVVIEGSSNVSLRSMSFVGRGAGDSAIDISQDGAAHVLADIQNNSFVGYGNDVIDLSSNPSTAGSLRVTISNNTIGDPSSSSSASENGSGIVAVAQGAGPSILTLDNNTIQGVADRGIDLLLQNVNGGSFDANVTNNTIVVTSSAGSDAVRVTAGALPGDTGTLCANLAGNAASSLPSDGISVHQRANTTFRLPGYSGPPDGTDLVRAHLAGQNPATSDTIVATTDFPSFGSGFIGDGPCAMPAGP